MEVDITLPDLGEDTADTVTIAVWLAEVGEYLEEGDDLLELTTDKAVFCMPCPQSGTLMQQCVDEGEDVEVGQVVSVLKV